MTIIPEYSLHAEDVRQAMLKTLQSHLSLKMDGLHLHHRNGARCAAESSSARQQH
jgi:hypothetical protein